MMDVTFLGTGTSQGVPLIACTCAICSSPDPLDKRLRTSVMVEVDGKVIVIDSGPDFRQQMLREKVKRLDALVFTHAHKDHIAGMDDIRAFNYITKSTIDVYADTIVQQAIHREFPYIFDDFKYPGVPEINLHHIGMDTFQAAGVAITPIEVLHYKLPVKGFRIGDFTYITDANFISDAEKEKIKGTRVLVLNALRKENHISHFNLYEAIDLAHELGASQTYLTHISHQLGMHKEVDALLPEGIHLAYDGLRIHLDS
jgi:phosphoribosyl 1,2-cyclic phosphate phosphodiesterase